MTFKRIFVQFNWHGVVAAVLAGIVFAAPAFAETTLERARKAGFVRAAFANEAPFGYATSDGKLTGESPEIAKVIFKKMGIGAVDGVLTEWASLLPGLNAGRWDLVAAGMFITPKRCKPAAFSEPTYKLGQAFLLRAGNPKNLHSYQDVKSKPDVTLGVMAGAVERDYARRVGIPDSQVKEFPDQASMLSAVKAGRVDAVALTALSIQRMAEKGGGDVERASPFEQPGPWAVGYGAFAFRKADKELLREFNKHLKAFVGSKEHLDLVRPFGWTNDDMPGDVTAAELCKG